MVEDALKMEKDIFPQKLKIERDGISAEGLSIPNVLFSFDDDKQSILSYPDTGIFVLFAGSHADPSIKEKYLPYIKEGKTTRTIIFQSRNAAAQFVLGEKGRTDDWR